MDYTKLGKTGLRVSVAGLGCGGNSRLGLGAGKSVSEAAKVVRAAVDLGVTYFDTARNYGTEPVINAAIKDMRRDSVVISTKSTVRAGGVRITADQLVANLDNSLKRLGTEYVDVYMLHGVAPADYDYALETLAPAILKERDKGKFRHLGIRPRTLPILLCLVKHYPPLRGVLRYTIQVVARYCAGLEPDI